MKYHTEGAIWMVDPSEEGTHGAVNPCSIQQVKRSSIVAPRPRLEDRSARWRAVMSFKKRCSWISSQQKYAWRCAQTSHRLRSFNNREYRMKGAVFTIKSGTVCICRRHKICLPGCWLYVGAINTSPLWFAVSILP